MRIVEAEVVAADDAKVLAQPGVDLRGGPRQPHDEFLEEGPLRRLRIDRKAGEPRDPRGRIMAVAKAELGDLPQAAAPHRGEISRGGERAGRGIGADVAGRLGAADVLLAGRQREHIAAAALAVDGLARDMSRQAPDMRHAGRKDAEMRTAERWSYAQTLPLGNHDVGP